MNNRVTICQDSKDRLPMIKHHLNAFNISFAKNDFESANYHKKEALEIMKVIRIEMRGDVDLSAEEMLTLINFYQKNDL